LKQEWNILSTCILESPFAQFGFKATDNAALRFTQSRNLPTNTSLTYSNKSTFDGVIPTEEFLTIIAISA